MRDECLVNQLSCALVDGSAACVPCEVGAYAAKDGSCQPLGGTPLSHDFPEQTSAPGEEIRGCRSWTLDNDAPLYVNAVELVQDEASHHSNWTFVPETEFDGPDGIWVCADRNYSQLQAALAGGVIYAQSTQATHEVQKFPDGAVIRIPARSRIISDIHLLNTSGQSVTGHANLTLYSIEESQAQVKLAPFHLSYEDLTIPPQSVSRFTGECSFESNYQNLTGGPVDLTLYWLLPHTHALGSRVFIEVMGGDLDGTSLIDVQGFNGEARGKTFDPPLVLDGITGMRFGCEFDNPRPDSVGWGFGDQEMCEALAFAATPLAFESFVQDSVAGPIDGSTATFTGTCVTAAFPFDTDK
jgi:hypothetical protein